ALCQVKRGSSNLPETCSTKTSFCCFLASSAALLGVDTKSTPVPKVEQVPSVLSLALTGEPAQAARPRPAAVHNRRRRMNLPPWGPEGRPLSDRRGAAGGAAHRIISLFRRVGEGKVWA